MQMNRTNGGGAALAGILCRNVSSPREEEAQHTTTKLSLYLYTKLTIKAIDWENIYARACGTFFFFLSFIFIYSFGRASVHVRDGFTIPPPLFLPRQRPEIRDDMICHPDGETLFFF